MPATDPSQIKGTNAAAKDAGHRNFPEFLQSYGLRISNDDDIQDGRAILRAMGYDVSSDLPEVEGFEAAKGGQAAEKK
jgi:hypothetical protein